MGSYPPGEVTLVERLRNDRLAYYYALDCADAAARAGLTDVGELSALLAVHFAGQLSGALPERTRER